MLLFKICAVVTAVSTAIMAIATVFVFGVSGAALYSVKGALEGSGRPGVTSSAQMDRDRERIERQLNEKARK